MSSDREIRLQLDLLEAHGVIAELTRRLEFAVTENQAVSAALVKERQRAASLLREVQAILDDESTRPGRKARAKNRARGDRTRRDVLRMTAERKSAAVIAEALQVSTDTVYLIRKQAKRAKSTEQ